MLDEPGGEGRNLMRNAPLPRVNPKPPLPPAMPSLQALKEILRRATDMGRITWSKNFQARCAIRGAGPGFNSVDAMNVIRHGRVVNKPVYEYARNAWRCETADSVEGFTFVVDIALDCQEDFELCPLVTIITGFFRRGGSKEISDWSNDQ